MSGGICSEICFALKWQTEKNYPIITKYLHAKIGGICSEKRSFLAEIRRLQKCWGDMLRKKVESTPFFTKITPFFTLFGGISAEMTGFLARI